MEKERRPGNQKNQIEGLRPCEMQMILFQDGKRYLEVKYDLKDQLRADISKNSRSIFGPNTIYLRARGTPCSSAQGGLLPAGLLFDFSDRDAPQLYLVDVEMSSQDFYSNILPRITRLLISINSDLARSAIVGEALSIIDFSAHLKERFERLGNNRSVHELLDDIVEGGIRLLLITNEEKREVSEMMQAYPDTWGKTVQMLSLKKYVCGNDCIFSINPGFHEMRPVNVESSSKLDQEGYHLPPKESQFPGDQNAQRGTTAPRTFSRKVSLTKVGGKGSGVGDTLIGWEIAPPKEGERYKIRFEKGKVLKTSPVQLITETNGVLCIMTANSLYEVRAFEAEQHDSLVKP
jgi:hypothetical protein